MASAPYGAEPTREQINALSGPVVIDFGTNWCEHCLALGPLLSAELARYPNVRHIKVEDGKGRPLGRSFRVKLWPTLVFLRDGGVLEQAARPSLEEVRAGLRAIAGDPSAEPR